MHGGVRNMSYVKQQLYKSTAGAVYSEENSNEVTAATTIVC